jgi:SsrA-binding protein
MSKDAILLIQDNKQARFDFVILETFEAGLELMGSEVKSLRMKQIQFKDSYISFKGEEAFLQNAHIAEYKASSYNNHAPERLRKLLLNKSEINKISAAIQEKGLTCVPLKIYFKKGLVKLDIALAKGKNVVDKRQSIKKRDVDRQLHQAKRTHRDR